MPTWGKKSSEDEPSGADVQKSHNARIERFLKKVEPRRLEILRHRDNPLKDLIAWGENVFDEKQNLEDQLGKTQKGLELAERRIETLEQDLYTTTQQLRQVSNEYQALTEIHNDEITKIAELHSQSAEEEKQKHNAEIFAWKMRYDDDMKDSQGIYERDIREERRQKEAQRQDYERQKEDLKSAYETKISRLVGGHKAESTKLVGQLLVNQKDGQGWPDDILRLRFTELQRLIESVTAPRNKEFLIPSDQKLGQHLDPTGFIGREGRGKSHFLLKSAVWAIFCEQLFSAPFGFGSLGPGNSRRNLMELYYAWRELFESSDTVSNSYDQEEFAIFYQDQLANNWRSATFQCINAALTSSDNFSAADSPLAARSTQTINQTVARIKGVLSEVASLSNSRIRSDMEEDIQKMVQLGSEIALQFGVHPAQLRLLVPSRGEQIQIGESYHDCEDGDAYKGSVYGVQLVTAPGLQKIGDGRSDMSSSRTMVPCEIYPDQLGS